MENNVKKDQYHFIGIAGISMSSLAIMLHDKGHKITGIDKINFEYKDILVQNRDDHELLPEGTDIVVYNMQTSKSFYQYVEGKEKNLKFIHRAQLLNDLTSDRFKICVTGGRGKTSTTYFTGQLMESLGLDPFILLGVPAFDNKGIKKGKGPYIVELNEADMIAAEESSDVLIFNYFSGDHIWDFDNSYEKMKQYYKEIIGRCKTIFYNADNEEIVEIMKCFPDKKKYGYGSKGDFIASNIIENKDGIEFDLIYKDKTFKVSAPVQGYFHAYNISAAIGVIHTQFCLEIEKIAECTKKLNGVRGRMEKIYEDDKLILIRDFAPNFYNISTGIQSAKKYNLPISIICDPHNEIRAKTFKKEFLNELKEVRYGTFYKDIAENGTLFKSYEDMSKFLNETNGVCLIFYMEHLNRETGNFLSDWIKHRTLNQI